MIYCHKFKEGVLWHQKLFCELEAYYLTWKTHMMIASNLFIHYVNFKGVNKYLQLSCQHQYAHRLNISYLC